MPRALKLLLLTSALAAPLCATAPARVRGQTAAAAQTALADDEVARGRQLLAGGDVPAAARLLRSAAERRKTDADAWYYLGLALSRAAKPKDARKAFERAVKLRPASAEARAGLAHALLVVDKPRDAEREASRAVALDAKNALAHYVIGLVEFRAGRHSRAAQEAEEALKSRADFHAAAALLADALLGLYAAESARVAGRHPVPPDADEETRKPFLERREAAMEPLKARMRAAADRLEALAKSEPAGALSEESQESADTLRAYGGAPRSPSERIFRMAEVSTRAVIVYKPEPAFTEKARQKNTTGFVRLRAVLTADGRVRHIIVLKGLPHGLTDNCVEVARRIRFKPATFNGEPVSQWVVLEYNFNVY